MRFSVPPAGTRLDAPCAQRPVFRVAPEKAGTLKVA